MQWPGGAVSRRGIVEPGVSDKRLGQLRVMARDVLYEESAVGDECPNSVFGLYSPQPLVMRAVGLLPERQFMLDIDKE